MLKVHWSTLGYLVVCLLLSKLLLDFFFFWVDLLTLPGALSLGVVFSGLLVRLGIQVICFPKSFSYFRRESEVEMLSLLSTRWLNWLGKVAEILSEAEDGELAAEENEELYEGKNRVEVVLRIFALMAKRKKLTQAQATLQGLFLELQKACSSLQVNNSLSFWEAMGSPIPLRVSDFTPVLTSISDLMSVLKTNLANNTWAQTLNRWVWNTSLGTLDYLRCEMETTLKCEQVWVLGDSGSRLDCMWIQGSSPSSAVLLCGGNGFVYECGLYMSDSLQYYLQKGLSVMMWNYRGYGRTLGWPSPAALTKDGLKVAEYILQVRNITKLMVHGESMGGMVAAYIAARANVTVLFADRTFASIESIAGTYGDKAKAMMKLLTQWSTDVVSDYISAKCFKMVSCDPHDSIIPELASLKNSVAHRLVLGTDTEALSKAQLQAAASSIRLIREQTSGGSLTPPLRMLKALIEDLDAGGKFLKCVTCDGATTESADYWSCCLLVWGSYYSREYHGTPCLELASSKLISAISILSALCLTHSADNQHAGDLLAFLTALNTRLTTLASMFPARQKPAGEFDPSPAFPSAGFLIPLNCGHNGCLSREERRFVDHLIRRSGLLSS